MLTQKQILEVQEHLEKAQNPIFFFDNDGDGLCSFLLLQRYIQRGKGVAIKSFPELTGTYFQKVNELNADYIFILDKPEVSAEFFKEVEQVNIPVVWIDHHEINKERVPEFVNYYNPVFNKSKTNEPVTTLCYQVTQRSEDLWLAVVGCISDAFVPDFYSDFKKNYPDLVVESNDVLDIYYDSQIGKIGKILNCGLKDKTTNVINMLKFLMKVKTPYEVLEESSKNHAMHKRFEEINKKYQMLIEKAKAQKNDVAPKGVLSVGGDVNTESKVLFFQYAGDLSISSDLANGLRHEFPEKFIVVAYVTGVKANISVRGKNVRDMVLKAIQGLEGATGGGHEDAVGAMVKIEDLEKFRAKFVELIWD